MSAKRKPKFKVGQVVFCRLCKRYQKIIEVYAHACLLDCPGKSGPVGYAEETNMRPLTKREAGR